jgi:hypothetical protein
MVGEAARIWAAHKDHFLRRCGACSFCRLDQEDPCLNAPGYLEALAFRDAWSNTFRPDPGAPDLPSLVLPWEPSLAPGVRLPPGPRLVTPAWHVGGPHEGDVAGLVTTARRLGAPADPVLLDPAATVAIGLTGVPMSSRLPTLILATGPWDAWCAELLSRGLPVCVMAAPSAAALPALAEALWGRRFGQVLVLPRPDPAERPTVARVVAELHLQGVHVRPFPTAQFWRACVPMRAFRPTSLAEVWTTWPFLPLRLARQAFADAIHGRLDAHVRRQSPIAA